MKKPPLWTKDFISVSGSNFFLFTSFYFLLVTLPVYVLKDLEGKASEAGLITTFFLFSAILIRPLAGQWIEKLGKKKIWISSLLIFSVASVAYFFISSLPALLLLRFFHGIGFGMATTAAGAIVADIIPNSRRGEGMGYFIMSNNLAMVIGPFLGLSVLQTWGSSVMFMISAAASVIALLTGVFIKTGESHASGSVSIFRVNWRLKDLFEYSALPIALVGGFFSIVYAALLSFVSVFADEVNLSHVSSYFFVVYAIVLLLSRPFTGRWFDEKGANFIVYPAIGLFGVGMYMLSGAGNAFMFLLAAGVIGVGWGTLFPSFQTIAIMQAPPEKKALATATFLSVYDLGIGLGSFVVGIVGAKTGFSTLYLYASIYIAAGLAIYYLLYGSAHRKTEMEESVNI